MLEPLSPRVVIERISSPLAEPAPVSAVTEAAPRMTERQRLAMPAELPVERERTQEPRPAAIIAQPRVRPAQRVEPAPPPPVEPSPTIQVTIGRVEVRATQPQVSTPKKQRPRPPVMSLDEYLRQRDQGGRS